MQVISPASTNPSSDGFGVIAVDNGNVVVGAYHTDAPGDAVGEAYLYAIEPNVPLTFDDQTVSVAENSPEGTLVATLAATNVAGSVTYSLAENSNPDGVYNTLAFRLEGDQLLINDLNDFDYENLSQLQVTTIAFDGVTGSQAIITVNVTNVIEPPLVSDDNYNVVVNNSLTVDAPGVLSNDTSLDTETLSAVLVDDVQHGTLQLNADGSFTYQPDQNYMGDDAFTYRVHDGATDSDTVATVTFEVSSLLHTLTNPNVLQGERFGNCIATDGNYVLVGAPANRVFIEGDYYTDGQAFLFDAATGSLIHTFDPPEGLNSGWERFGSQVAIDGNLIVISDPLQDLAPNNGTNTHELGAGQAYLYDATTGDLIRVIDDPEPTYTGYFGNSLAIDGNHILIGNARHFIPRENGVNESIGQAYLFDATTGALLHTLDDPTPTSSGEFGGDVAIDGDRILIGASGGWFASIKRGSPFV